MKTALSVVGKKEEATVDTVMKAIADTRGLIHKARLLVKEVSSCNTVKRRKIRLKLSAIKKRRKQHFGRIQYK